MTPIINKADMIRGDYYLCYEKFDGYEKAIFIGKYVEHHDLLDGKVFSFDRHNYRQSWCIYDDFKCDGDDPLVVQWVFKMTDMEVYKHVLLEEI